MRPLFYSGTEVIAAKLPDDAQLVLPPEIGPGFADVRAAVDHALKKPVDGQPLEERVHERSKVLVVFDGPGYPVPPLRVDARLGALEAILGAIDRRGVPLENVTLLCSTGVTRLFRNTEIAKIAGVQVLASHEARCHDAESNDGFAVLGQTDEGEAVEIDEALTKADLVVTLAVAQGPIHGGWSTLVPGVASVACARAFLTPKNLAQGLTPFAPASNLQQALARAGAVIEKKVPLFHVELVLDTRLWFKPMIDLLRTNGSMPRPVAAWDKLPEPIRARASRLFRSEYQTIGVAAGSAGAAHAKAVALLAERSYVAAEQADVVALGVPAVAPHTLNGYDNPVLDVGTAFGFVLAWNQGKPLVRKGGVVVLLTPLHERFAKPAHAPYLDFYEKVLADTRDPEVMAERYEANFAGRPEYVAAYRRRFAHHGLEPFHVWYQAWNVLSQVGKVIVVGAPKATAARFGFEVASSLERALDLAREHAGKDASLAVPVVPPVYGMAVR